MTYWDKFYHKNQDKFFKDRTYLHLEYPELNPLNINREQTTHFFNYMSGETASPPTSESDANAIRWWESINELNKDSSQTFVMEVGCGAGNTVFPLLKLNPEKYFYAFDFSPHAVNLVKDPLPEMIKEDSIDIVLMIFVLSAVSYEKMNQALTTLYKALKPGGIIYVRDYGLYDMTQLRFLSKKGRKIDQNFYLRSDGTRTYFFTTETLSQLFNDAGYTTLISKYDTRELRNRKKMISISIVDLQVSSDNYQTFLITYLVAKGTSVQFDITLASNSILETIKMPYFLTCHVAMPQRSSSNLYRIELAMKSDSLMNAYNSPVIVKVVNNLLPGGSNITLNLPPITSSPTTVINYVKHTYDFSVDGRTSRTSRMSFLTSIDNLNTAVQFYNLASPVSVLIPLKGSPSSGLYTLFVSFVTIQGSIILYDGVSSTNSIFAYSSGNNGYGAAFSMYLYTNIPQDSFYGRIEIRFSQSIRFNYTYHSAYPSQSQPYPLGLTKLSLDLPGAYYIQPGFLYSKYLDYTKYTANFPGNDGSTLAVKYLNGTWTPALPSPDITPPVLNSYNITKINSNSFIVRVNISDDQSGFDFLTLYNGNIIHSYDIIASSPGGNLYEVQCYTYPITSSIDVQTSHLWTMVDKAGNSITLPFNRPYNTALGTIYFPPYGISYITFFEFKLSNSDLSVNGANGFLYIQTKSMDPLATPSLYFTDATGNYDMSKLNVGSYVDTLDMYVIPFTIRAKLFTRSLAYILNTFTRMDAELLSTNPLIGSKAFLNITSNYADEIGPLLVDVYATPDIKVVMADDPQSIGWVITIEDVESGFDHGVAMITSEYDIVGRNITFSVSDVKSGGNASRGVYYISFVQQVKLRAQNYRLNLILYDTLGNMASDPLGDLSISSPFVSPFINLNTAQLAQLSINVSLSTFGPQNIPPVLTNIVLMANKLTGQRTLDVFLTVSSNVNSGIDLRYPPIFYVISTRGRFISFPTLPEIANPTSPPVTANFSVTANIPYSFCQEPMVYGLYGITDLHNNVVGYDHMNLMAFGITSSDLAFENVPVLDSCTEVTQSGGPVFISGHNLGLTSNITVIVIGSSGDPAKQTLTFHSVVTIGLTLKPFIGTIYIHVIVDGVKSNDLPVTIPIPGDDGANITEIISVVSLVELDSTDKHINTFVFGNWSLTNLTSDDILTYLYTVSLPNRQTSVNVTIQFFRETTIVPFAGANITYAPFTIKYSVELDHYEFGS
eukprot:gene3701-4263_t